MTRRRIIPIVEGHGEERAVPCLLQRWLEHRQFHKYFEIPDLAINAKGCGRLKAAHDMVRHIGIEHYIRAALRNKPDAILVVLDADDECRKRGPGNGLGPELLARAKTVASHVPLAVVVANREYEAWFLANITSFRARGLFFVHAEIPGTLDPESPRDCKGLITKLMGRRYEETVDQLELTDDLRFSLGATRRSPSYGKLIRDLERITHEARRKFNK
jgi:hypothetical protein